MKSRKYKYLVIVTVILLVIVVIGGAGFCYMDWTGISFGNPVSGEESSADGETSSSLHAAETSTESPTESEEMVSVGETPAEEPAEPEVVFPITMEHITVLENGEYQYVSEGTVLSHKGIDVSKYQKTIDWTKAAEDGVEFAFIRAGYRGYGGSGVLVSDETYHQNMKGAKAAGIRTGVYFFSQAVNKSEAEEEAEFLIEAMKDYEIDYPVAVDMEYLEGTGARQNGLTREARTEVCVTLCEALKEAGYTPIIYGDEKTFTELLDIEELLEYDLWLRATDGTIDFPYEIAVWQYSQKGSVSGIAGDTDLNIALKEW